ncbi:cofactor of BRCA1-domain-containing protein [Dichotomocladium elegans]|nr:cofactor of BRCA1-domain-containing protein [Dichotomocladium elegans]
MSKILLGPATETIYQQLTGEGDLEKAINDIQKIYGLDIVPSMDSIYPLLDLSGCSRLEIHWACLHALNTAAVEKIKTPEFLLADFERVFSDSFKYIRCSHLQPIPMALLKKFSEHIDQDVLDQLKNDQEVFQNCPLNVKQQIWKQDETFFQVQVLSMLNEYHHDEELQKLSMNLRPDSYQEVLTERRNHPQMTRMMEMINGDPKLYLMFLETVQIVFRSTPYPSLCSIRVDILMNYHDRDISEVYEEDKCHDLIWSLDTCVRQQNMDDVIIEKIKQCFDHVKNGTQLYSEFAMILMDPVISNFLTQCIVRWLRISVDDDAPGNLEQLINYNAKLLNLAEHAPAAANLNQKIPKLDKDLRGRFWNALCTIIVEENNPKAYVAPSESEVISSMLLRSETARKAMIHYCIDRAYEGDVATLQRCLPFILESLPLQDDANITHVFTYQSFVGTFVSVLAKKWLLNCVKDVMWRQVVMENFLLQIVRWDPLAHKQVVLLLSEYFLKSSYLTTLNEKSEREGK